MFEKRDIIIIDVETTSLNVDEAKIKWFGAYSYLNSEYYLLEFDKNKKDILGLIKNHKIIIGFNFKEYDKIVLENNFKDDNLFEYKVILDFLEISAPKQGKSYGMNRKNRLAQMGYRLKNFTLKAIIEELKLDKDGVGTKGDIDYKIFQKDDWTPEEVAEIKKYLKQDIDLTKVLFEWYHKQYEPLCKFLPKKDQDNFLHLKCSLSVLAYNIICNKAGLKVDYGEKTPGKTKSFEGGHHLEYKKDLTVGNIIEIDIQCLHKDTKVITSTGEEKISELKIGDKVKGVNDFERIAFINKKKVKQLYKITLENGQTIFATPEHKFPIKKMGDKRVDELKIGDNMFIYKKQKRLKGLRIKQKCIICKSKIKNIEIVEYNDDVYDITLENQELPYFYANNILSHNSAYPNAIIQGNLCSPIKDENEKEFWNGDNFYILEGKYNNKEQGKIESALKEIFLERLKAKKEGDKPKNLSYKIILNSYYGILSNAIFKSVYNRNSAADCTSMVRTWIKKLAKTLDIYGFTNIYGFTDSIFVLVPPHLNKNILMYCVNNFINEAKSHVKFPCSEFKMGVEEEIKMIWFVAKNCYLFVTQKDEIKYKSTLLNTNTPLVVMKLFEEYMKPIIIKSLSIPFTKKELEEQIKLILEKQPELATQEYKVTELSDYKVKTSLQYQISNKYGPGRHFLIPNRKRMGGGKEIGVGLNKNTKKKAGLRYCTMEEFKEAGFKINDIDLTQLLSHLKPFYEKNEPKPEKGNYTQALL